MVIKWYEVKAKQDKIKQARKQKNPQCYTAKKKRQ